MLQWKAFTSSKYTVHHMAIGSVLKLEAWFDVRVVLLLFWHLCFSRRKMSDRVNFLPSSKNISPSFHLFCLIVQLYLSELMSLIVLLVLPAFSLRTSDTCQTYPPYTTLYIFYSLGVEDYHWASNIYNNMIKYHRPLVILLINFPSVTFHMRQKTFYLFIYFLWHYSWDQMRNFKVQQKTPMSSTVLYYLYLY